jgi:hypothetical protein
MWQLFIVQFFDWWEIQFDKVWSKLIHFGQIWSKKIQNQTGIFSLFVNVKTFYRNIFWFVRNPIWSSLIHFGQIWSKKIPNKTAIFILFVNVTTFYSNIFWLVRNTFWSSLIKVNQVWSSLIKFNPFWTDQVWNNISIHNKGQQTQKRVTNKQKWTNASQIWDRSNH